MPLNRTEAALAAIESEKVNPLLESFLAQYAAVVFYSEMEEQVATLIEGWLRIYSHQMIASLVSSSLKEIIKRTKKSDIADFAERFGPDFKEAFNACIAEDRVSRYANVIKSRHLTGHGRGATITLQEVRLGVEVANEILEALDTCFRDKASQSN